MLVSERKKKIIENAGIINDKGSLELGFICRSMVSASMPHTRVNGLIYKRKTNNFVLSIIGNEESGGIPYGTYPRLILSWLAGEVTKTQDREIRLGSSLSDFMKKLGLQVTGGRWGTVNRFKEQLKMIFSSIITFSYNDPKKGEWIQSNMSIAEKTQIFWDPQNPEEIDLFKSRVILSESFFNEILTAPIPVDIRAINVLKDSSLALDIYFWLNYRMGYLKKTSFIPYRNLQMQFGGNYQETSQGRYEFRRCFLRQIQKVTSIYQEANIKPSELGVLLSPSRSHVPKVLRTF